MGLNIVLILLVVAGVGGYFKYTQDKIETLQQNNAKLTMVAKTNEETINNLQRDAIKSAEKMNELNVALKKDEVYIDELNQKLRKHNLTKIANTKPKMLEKRINDGTKDVFTSIADDSKY